MGSPSLESSSFPTELHSSEPSYSPTISPSLRPSPVPSQFSSFEPSKKSSPQACCSWNQSTCGSSSWCNKTKNRCENNCNGYWINPNAPPPAPGPGCCTWGNGCGNSQWCNAKRTNCIGPCKGSWIPL